MGHGPSDLRADVERFCAGSHEACNGLEERLDMIVAQLSVIACELKRMNDMRAARDWREMTRDK